MSEPGTRPDQPLVEPLTDRELEILGHMAQYLTNQQIAEALILSLNTVKWYARQIYGKLGVEGRRDAVSRATDLGLLGEVAAATAPVQRLPAQLTPFLGRQEEMGRVCSLLSDPTARLVTVVGPGGTGKTRLAIEAAACLYKTCGAAVQDGVFFVSLAPLQNPGEITSAIAQAIGFQFYQADVSLDQQLVQYLSNKRKLLVLDNLEHLIGPESIRLLADLLAEAPQVKVLATSRSRLNVQGEHLFPLDGLSVPEEGEAARWENPALRAEAYSSIQLFAHSARRLAPDFEINAANLPHIIQICSLVGGLPLGIELAAGWMAILEPEQIAGEIAMNLDILATEADNVPERQQSLRAVFDSSWRLLSDPEREAFLGLAAFEGGFDLSAAQRASGLSLQTLLDLVNKSWVQQGSGGRFTFHDLLHHYGREKLATDPKREMAVRELHSSHFCAWLGEQESDTWGPQQQTVLAAIEADIENVHAACIWAAEQGRVQRLRVAANALGLFYFQWRANPQAGESIFGALAETLRAHDQWPAADRACAGLLIARVLGWQSSLCGLVGDVQKATYLLNEGSAILDRFALDRESTKQERAHFAWQRGYQILYVDPEGARQKFSESLELYRETCDSWGTASALLGLGRALRGGGEFEEAEQALVASLSLHREMGNQHGESETLTTLAALALLWAQFEQAEGLIQRSLSITPKTDRYGTAFGLGLLGRARLYTGRFAEAEEPLLECIALHEELGMRGFGLGWSFTLGRDYLHQGRYDEARTLAEQVLTEARSLNYTRGITAGLILHAEVALGTGAFAEADRYLRESAAEAGPDVRDRYEHGQLATLILAAREPDRRVEAEQQMLKALNQASSDQGFWLQIVALVGAALLYVNAGEAERAVELYALASRYGSVANSVWFRDVVGQTIAGAAADLSPEALGAARERGAGRELDGAVLELLHSRYS